MSCLYKQSFISMCVKKYSSQNKNNLTKMNSKQLSARKMLFFFSSIISIYQVKSQDCQNANSAAIKLSITSQRNSSGHRNMKVSLQSRARAGGAADLAGVETPQTVTMCSGVHIYTTTAVVTAPPAVFRSSGYELFPGLGYFKFHPTSATWDEAVHTCQEEGGVLLSPSSDHEAGAIKNLMARKVTVVGATWPHWVYAGFHDRGIEGQYYTLEGKLLNESGYQKWIGGEPSNKAWGTEGDEDCGGVSNLGLMQDLPCLAKLPFICKQPL